MEFSSTTFLFIFLPIVFLLYLVMPWKGVRNWLLIAASLVFYAWGEPLYVLLMLFSALANFFAARFIDKRQNEGKSAKALLIVSICFNIGLLAAFKYSGFAAEIINGIFGAAIPVPSIPSPLGISFFTFQAVSYVVDVYRKKVSAAKRFSLILLYISFFAQLVQGPIIRYGDIESQLEKREFNINGIQEGLRLFIIGLAMKLLIANTLGKAAAYVYALQTTELNAAFAWTGAICFLLQIYFDFAGYSQMAIGLGAMFGFTIPKNFNYPYISCSVSEFWRRWHITLSSWFRDYVYIPLGGNRCSTLRTGVNKIIVFLLTGLWHGASWNFVAWGAYNGAFLLGEGFVKKRGVKIPKVFAWLYTIIVVTIGFVIFNSPNMAYAFAMVKNMFSGFSIGADTWAKLSTIFSPMFVVTFFAAVIAATPAAKLLCQRLTSRPKLQFAVRCVCSLVLLALCLFALASGSYNPSIYTQF